jgi:hypothetical protein
MIAKYKEVDELTINVVLDKIFMVRGLGIESSNHIDEHGGNSSNGYQRS